jgi:hypothetical protein
LEASELSQGLEDSGDETVRITFSLSPDLAKKLKQEADDSHVSFSALMRQVLEHHINWTSVAGRAGFTPVPRQMVTMLLDQMTDEQISKVAQNIAKNRSKDIQLLMTGEYTAQSFLANLEAWAAQSNMAYKRKVAGGIYELAVQHDMGKKWSLYFARMCEAVLRDSLKKKLEYNLSDSVVILKVYLK